MLVAGRVWRTPDTAARQVKIGLEHAPSNSQLGQNLMFTLNICSIVSSNEELQTSYIIQSLQSLLWIILSFSNLHFHHPHCMGTFLSFEDVPLPSSYTLNIWVLPYNFKSLVKPVNGKAICHLLSLNDYKLQSYIWFVHHWLIYAVLCYLKL